MLEMVQKTEVSIDSRQEEYNGLANVSTCEQGKLTITSALRSGRKHSS